MTASIPASPPSPASPPIPPVSQSRALRRLFLTLFLRGRSSRGLQAKKAPVSVARKLAMTLLFYALFGAYAVVFTRQSVFMLSAYLHAMTFMLLGMFVASSAGEVLFNKEEADILLHRPVEPRVMLWAKVRVMIEISLWLAFAANLAGLALGMFVPNGSWRFPLVHAASTALEAAFCCGSVVLVYQLCLRWFGRQRLEGLMTTTQVIVAIAVVLSGQLLPQLALRVQQVADVGRSSWWLALLPPAWFAGFDDALAGSGAAMSWLLALLAILASVLVLWLAFGKLAHDYEAGLQALGEAPPTARRRGGRRFMEVWLALPPWRWWCREPVARASFLLTAAYLMRDRDVKLRVYPSLAPIMVMPAIFLMHDLRDGGAAGSGFGIAFASSYLGIVPYLALSVLQFSQQWQAADIFRAAPLAGPAQICHGARQAVLTMLVAPTALIFAITVCVLVPDRSQLLLLLPGLISLPIYALVPALLGSIPLSRPSEEAKSAGRGLVMIAVMLISFAISGLALFARHLGWFWGYIAVETITAVIVYSILHRRISRLRWPVME